MRIGELARRTGTTARALRHYEESGLISSTRAANGYRMYDEGAVVRVSNIRYLLDAGLTLEDVAAFEPCLDGDMSATAPSAGGLAIARERLAVLDARIAVQTEARNRLAAALASHAVAPDQPHPATTARTTAAEATTRASATPATGSSPED
ncbi:MerR family transcriptional regulator [Streptomyces sp. NPDC126499]|uniref:MerR family transcriptional regulator n=1 Tax=Streptomyces sp. NPDC126499 TaxID=3155314 RepID=UPI00332B3DC4